MPRTPRQYEIRKLISPLFVGVLEDVFESLEELSTPHGHITPDEACVLLSRLNAAVCKVSESTHGARSLVVAKSLAAFRFMADQYVEDAAGHIDDHIGNAVFLADEVSRLQIINKQLKAECEGLRASN